jgi:hypothetical protein
MRTVMAVVVGWIAAIAWVMLSLTAIWAVFGVDLVFREGTTETSNTWIIVSSATNFVGAMLGGFICMILARSRSRRPVLILAGVVFALGMLNAFIPEQAAQDGAGDDPATLSDRTAAEASRLAEKPGWYGVFISFVLALGAFAGGDLVFRARRRASPPGTLPTPLEDSRSA